MKILYVEAYPGFRGAQRSLATLVDTLASLSEGEIVATVRCTHEGRSADGYRRQGIEVEIHPSPACLREVGGGLARRRLSGQIDTLVRGLLPDSLLWLKRMRRDRPDLVHCNQARAVLLAGPAARLLGIPVIWHQRGLLNLPPTAGRLTAACATDVVCVSNAVRESLPKTSNSKARVIPNAVDPDHLPPDEVVSQRYHWLEAAAQKRGARQDALHVVTASSFLPYKGLHHLATALGTLLERRPDWRQRVAWTIMGDSEGDPARERYKHHLERQINGLPFPPAIHWASWVDQPLPVLAAADLVVLPTIQKENFRFHDGTEIQATCSEGLPRTVLEALAVGSAVIATDVAGVRDLLVDGENGCIVSAGNAGALEQAIEALLDDSEQRQRLGRAARQRAKIFSPNAMGESMMTFYRQILESPSLAPQGATRWPR